MNCWSLVKVWNIEQYFVHWYCESLHQITGDYRYHEWQWRKTPTVSPDQGATGETVSSTKKMDVGTQVLSSYLSGTGLSEEEKDAQYKKDYAEGVFGLLEEIRSMLSMFSM